MELVRARWLVLPLVFALVLALGIARPARAQLLEATAAAVVSPILPASLTAQLTSVLTTGTVVTPIATSGAAAAGSAGTVSATGAVAASTGVALAPVAGVVAIGTLAIGAAYVGTRYALGDGMPWEWNEQVDPGVADVEARGTAHVGWVLSPDGCQVTGQCATSNPNVYQGGYTWFYRWQPPASIPQGMSLHVGVGVGPNWEQNRLKTPSGGITAANRHQFGNDIQAQDNFTGSLQQLTVRSCMQSSGTPIGGCAWSETTVDVFAGWAGQSGDAARAPARITTEAQCTSKTGVTRTVEAHSPSYAPTDPVPLIPGVQCAPDEKLTGLRAYRTVPGVPTIPDVPILDPLSPIETVPAPSYVPAEWVEEWEKCAQLIPGETCDLEIWKGNPNHEDQEERRRAVPCDPWVICDFWWKDTQRELKYSCIWHTPGGLKIPLPLAECQALQWEQSSSVPPVLTTQPPPVLSPPGVPTLTPPTTGVPVEGRDCLGAPEDPEQGFISRVVFKGVKCALVWAFVPTSTATQVTQLREELSTRPPVSVIVPVTGLVTGLWTGWDVTCGTGPSFWPFKSDGSVASSATNVQAGRLPCAPPDSQAWQFMYGLMNLALIAGAALGAVRLTSQAMKGPE